MIHGLNKITEASGLGYLMSSYTAHPDGFDEAEDQAQDIAADLMRDGLVVFAPIAYGPGIDKKLSNGMLKGDADYYRSHEFWMPICERFFQRCDYGIIATTPGWHKSTGIAIELFYLVREDIPIWFYDPEDYRILTFEEAAEKWEDEVEELLRRSYDLQTKHLNVDSNKYPRAVRMIFKKMAANE